MRKKLWMREKIALEKDFSKKERQKNMVQCVQTEKDSCIECNQKKRARNGGGNNAELF